MIRRVAVRIAETGCRRLPPEWGEAARSELQHVRGTRELLGWVLGLARLALPPARAWLVGLAAAAVLAWLDLHIEPAAGSLIVLLALAGAAGAVTGRPWLSGAVVGSAIAAAHLVLTAAGRAAPVGHPQTSFGALSLLVLLFPALLAAHLGSRLRPR